MRGGCRRKVGHGAQATEIGFHFKFKPFFARRQQYDKEKTNHDKPHFYSHPKNFLKRTERLGWFGNGLAMGSQDGSEKRLLRAHESVESEAVGARGAPGVLGRRVERPEEHDRGEAAKGEVFVGEVGREDNKPEFNGFALEDLGTEEKANQHQANNDFSEAHIVREYIFLMN